jgi:signal transduction histidine kinase
VFIADDELLHAQADPALIHVVRSLRAANVALAVPIVEDDALAAVVLVGEKRSGGAFGRDELDLLTAVARNAGIALRNARLYDDLRRRIEEVHTAHTQLSQSAKLAAIGELAASVAHEVNNPLMVIFGHAERLRRDVADKPAALARLDAINEQTQRATKIMRRLLDFARRREPALSSIDIREVLQRSLDLVAGRLAHGKVVADVEHVGRGLPGARRPRSAHAGVREPLQQCADAMPEGGTLGVRTELRAADGIPCLTISVSDTGVGIASDELSHVFQPFFTTKPDGKGTGLGLSVSLGIVRKHEGTLEVVSERGKGSTFLVSLPLAR